MKGVAIMTPQERLDKKFKEVLEKRGELADRLELQEAMLKAVEKVMDIFSYSIDNGKKVHAVRMYKNCNQYCFSVQVANGEFEDKKSNFPNKLKVAIEKAEYCMYDGTKDWVLENLEPYFDVSEENNGTVIISI